MSPWANAVRAWILRQEQDRTTFEGLLADADLLIHGYRPDAMEKLAYGEAARRAIAPALIDVSLDAYGWAGPLGSAPRFDSLVQMSCGIAHAGMRWAKKEKTHPTAGTGFGSCHWVLDGCELIAVVNRGSQQNKIGSANSL